VNTYSGATTVLAGTLAWGDNNVISDASALVVNGATAAADLGTDHTDTVRSLLLDGGGIVTGSGAAALSVNAASFDVRSGTVNVSLNGSGSLNKSTAGAITLTAPAGYTGGTTVAAGTLVAPRLSNGTLTI